jgi:lysozyme family protein
MSYAPGNLHSVFDIQAPIPEYAMKTLVIYSDNLQYTLGGFPMADFREALAFTLTNEGGWSNNSKDAGKETYEGLSRANWPYWAGWSMIDQVKLDMSLPTDGAFTRDQIRALNTRLAAIPELQNLITSFYDQQFWLPPFSDIHSQPLATKLFDAVVNMGLSHGIACLQQALTAAGYPTDADGKFGPKTLAAVNACVDIVLMPLYVEYLKSRYRDIVAARPSDAVFLSGWETRADRMPSGFQAADISTGAGGRDV